MGGLEEGEDVIRKRLIFLYEQMAVQMMAVHKEDPVELLLLGEILYLQANMMKMIAKKMLG
jgi:hypothetical protein